MINAHYPIDLSAMQRELKYQREIIGKETKPHHYKNEIFLVRYALAGNCKSYIDLKNLAGKQRWIASRAICYNRRLIRIDASYQVRKQACRNLALKLQSKT